MRISNADQKSREQDDEVSWLHRLDKLLADAKSRLEKTMKP